MAWLQAGETWINMDQAVHVAQEGDDAVITFAVGLSSGTFPYAQRYTGEAAGEILRWLHIEATVEAAENALTLATMEDEMEDELDDEAMTDAFTDALIDDMTLQTNLAAEVDTVMIFDVDDDRDDSGSEDDDEELLETPPRPTAPPPQR